MTLYDLYHTIADIGIQITDTHIPVLKNGKEVKLDFRVVSDDYCKVLYIDMTEEETE